ncbi:capsule biosynthesis GfcC family protein [Celerinatantimonas sp. YJH-8]|uniref:capsule biosynthesis GfcC family protein n=1 Tax=Celerinatantimonas sp. YJH-8 TaxID=3228714 RepID=UPI0038C79EF0
MINQLRWIALLIGLIAGRAVAGDMALQVMTQGQFVHPQTYQVPSKSRLATVINQWQLSPQAYRLGIALLRRDEQRWQNRLRWALLYQLDDGGFNTETRTSLHHQILKFVATGRVLERFDWDLVDLIPNQNRPLQQDDTFVAPLRPNTVSVGGAAESDSLPFVPGQTVAQYMNKINRLPGFDPSYVWVVSPDTTFYRVGVSYWNREQAYLAPGSVIYVPLKDTLFHHYQAFNQSMLRLYAAQELPH